MTTSEILGMLDEEIRLLERAKALLTEAEPAVRRRGRPKGSTNQQTRFNPAKFAVKPRRTMSASAGEHIAAAQRLRWAKQKGTAEPKKTSKKAAVTGRAGKRATSPRKSASQQQPAAEAEATA